MPEISNSENQSDLIQRQAAASHELTSCVTFVDMAAAIAQHMPLEDGQFVTINHVTDDLNNQLFRLQMLAWANPNQAAEGGNNLEIPLPGSGYPLEADAAAYQSVLLVNHVQGDNKLNTTYRNWLAADKIVSFASFPIRFAGHMIGTLVINSKTTPVNLSAESCSQYQLLANQLGALIQVNNLNIEVSFRQELIERQSRTFAELTANMNFEQMAATVARHMLPTRGRFLGISQLVRDEQGSINTWRILTSANREHVYSWSDTPPLMWDALAPALKKAALAGKPFVMPSIRDARPDDNSPELHNLLSAIHVESYVSIPMLVDELPTAALLIMSRTPNDFTADEVNAFTNLGDQMGTLIHSRALLEEAQDTQKLALQLVQTNRNITLTNTIDDIGQALLAAMPSSVSGLTIALFSRPIQGREKPSNLETVVLADHQGVQKLARIDRLSGDNVGLGDTVRLLQNNEVVAHNPSDTRVVLPPLSLAALYAGGASRVTVFGLQTGTKLIGVLGLASNEPLDKTPQQGANLRAIADQIGITLENRSLLAQTTESLNLVQMQFETSNTIYRSTNPGEILEAIYRFAGSTYQRAQIALVEPDSETPVLRIVAEIQDGKTALLETVVPMEAYPAHQTLKSLETLYIPDVATDTYLSDAERANLIEQQIDSMLIVPMVVNTNLVGVLAFMNRIQTNPTPTSMRALRHMADLAAVVVENRSLLQITGQSLEETQLLYEINRVILGAQDTLDVLRVIRQLLAPDASAISELSVTYDEANQIAEMTVNYLNTPEGEQAVQVPLRSQLGTEALSRMQDYWNTNRSVVTIIEDLETADREYPIAEFIRMSGARSFVNIVVRQGSRVQQVISMSFREARHFSRAQRRLFVSLSDQIGIVMQNHNLLREAQQSAVDMSKRVGQLQGINQVSGRILRASDEAAMVNETSEALVKLLAINHCGITLVDPNDPDFLIVAGEYPQQGALNARLPLKNNPLWDALQKRNFQPLYVSSREDQLIEPATREVLTQMGVYSLGIVPIIANDRIIGSVGLDMTSSSGKITPEMLELAQILTVPLNIGLQNLRLLRNIQSGADRLSEQVETLRSLQQIEAHISSAQDEATLLKQAAQDVAEILKADHCGIVLLDSSLTLGTVVSEYPEHGAVGIQFTVAGNPLFDFMQGDSYRPVVINDIETDPILDEENRAYQRKAGTKAMIVLPLLVHERVIGSLGIDLYSLEQTISLEMIDLAQTVASQIALALQNRRLVTEAQRRASQLQRVASFNQKAQASLDRGQTFEIMIAEASQMLPQNHISISLFDKADQQLKVVAQRTDDNLHLNTTDGDIIPLSGQMQAVWEKAQPLYVPDLRAVAHEMDVGVTLRSWLVLPVTGRSNVVGIVSVGSDQAFAYSQTDIFLFGQLVTQFGVVLENIDTYRHNQQTARNESLVNDISAQLQRQLDIQGMLNITATELGKAIGARRARIRLATSIPETDSQSSAE